MHCADKSKIPDRYYIEALLQMVYHVEDLMESDDTEWEKLVACSQNTMPDMSLLSEIQACLMKHRFRGLYSTKMKKFKKSRCSWSTCVSNVSLPWDEYQWMSSYQAWCGPRALPSVAACCCIPYFHTADMHTSSLTGMIIFREQHANVQWNNIIITNDWVCMKAIRHCYHFLTNRKY